MASILAKTKKGSGGLVSPKRVANTKKATIRRTKPGTAQTTNPITTVLAKKSTGIIEKISVQAGAKNTRSLAAANTAEIAMEHAFSKDALLVKQSKKTTTRKQGGVRFGTLNEKQLKTLANRQEAGPSSVE